MKNKRIRITSQRTLIGLLIISTTLPGVTNTIKASTKETMSSPIINSKNEIETINKNTIDSESSFNTLKEFEDDLAVGTFGTSQWRVDSEGTLHFSAGEFPEGAFVQSEEVGTAVNKKITKVIFDGTVKANANSKGLFQTMNNVTEIVNLSNLDTSNVTDMKYMFAFMPGLKTLDLSHFNTSNVTEMTMMFYNSYMINCLDFSNFDTSNVTDMTNFLGEDVFLTQLILGEKFNFQGDENLPEITTNEDYTGKWVNVASGSIEYPKGKNVWTSTELLSEYNSSTDSDVYVWQPQPKVAADVTVKYENSNGEEIHDSKTLGGNVGDSYDATTDEYKLKIDGYNLDESNLPDNATGTFTDQAQTITYIYSKAPVAGGDVTVKYIDTKENKISDDIVKSGNIGDDYSTEQKDIDGYTFKEVQGNPTGQFTDTAQTVTYMYSKNSVIGEDFSHITVHDSSLKVGDKWSPEENFDEATDFEGNIENFSDIIVDGTVDTTKPGTYEVTYKIPEEHLVKSSLVEGHHSATAKIVVANKDTETGGSGSESNNSGNNTGSSEEKNSVSTNLSVNNELAKESNNILPQTGEDSSTLVFIAGIALLIIGSFFAVFRFKKINN